MTESPMHSAGPDATGGGGGAGAAGVDSGAGRGGLDVVVCEIVVLVVAGAEVVEDVEVVDVVVERRVVEGDEPVAAASPAPSSPPAATATAVAATRVASSAATASRRGRREGASRLERCWGSSGMAASWPRRGSPRPSDGSRAKGYRPPFANPTIRRGGATRLGGE